MSAFTTLLLFALGGEDLPRTLASEVPHVRWSLDPEAAAPKAAPLLTWTLGARIGVASAYDSDDEAFDIGAQLRVRILDWLGAEASIDVQSKQSYEHNDIDVFILPIQFSALFYPPLDWVVKPYGVAGVGFYYYDVTYSGALAAKKDKSDFRPGFHLGFGIEYAVTPSISVNSDLRFLFINGSASGNDFDYFQLTFGVNFKLF
jgi:opacity protein-like surface antigen